MSVSRRQFLKAKGAVLTLPFLPSLARGTDSQAGQGQPSKKLVMMYVPAYLQSIFRKDHKQDSEARASQLLGSLCGLP